MYEWDITLAELQMWIAEAVVLWAVLARCENV